jgi:long-chain acyl-CoA synthetase
MKTIVDEIRARAGETPEQEALVEYGSSRPFRMTYRALVEEIDRKLDGWKSVEVHPGDRCGLKAPQGIEFITTSLAILDKGLCLVPISDDYSGDSLETFRVRAGLHFLCEEANNFDLYALPVPDAVDGDGDKTYRSLDPAYLRFTSGTTNERKGVILSHRAILERLEAANKALEVTPDDRIVWLLPMAHHLVVSIFLYLRFGATILLPGSILPRPILEMAREEEATFFYASPYHYQLLADEARSAEWPGSVRLAISTASGLTEGTANSFFDTTGLPLVQALGVIEVGLPAMNIRHGAEKPLSLGQVLPDYEVWLRADDGRPVKERGPDRGVGEICLRGPGLFDAYLSPWRLAASIMEPDGFRTGDLGYFDEEGDLFMLGRRHNRINMAGMKFFCEEVEVEINQHPKILECRVFGEEHDHLGEVPVVEVVPIDPNDPPTLREIYEYCLPRLNRHKVPTDLRVVDRIAKTPTGKIKRW